MTQPEKATRRQLTLFVPDPAAAILEPIRQRVDPVQHSLIAAHVTLCREDELVDIPLAQIEASLAEQAALTLQFGPAESFSGHGVLLPCVGGEASFHQLRLALLKSTSGRQPRAHITLAHPRNPHAPGNTPSAYASLPPLLEITILKVSLIEQFAGEPWQVVQEYTL